MADTLKVLGQQAPNATTETDLYTVPASTQALGSTLVVCNRGGPSTTFRISVSVGGGVTANKDYTHYDCTILANDSLTITIGISLSATDKVRVYAGNANLSFALFGMERT